MNIVQPALRGLRRERGGGSKSAKAVDTLHTQDVEPRNVHFVLGCHNASQYVTPSACGCARKASGGVLIICTGGTSVRVNSAAEDALFYEHYLQQ